MRKDTLASSFVEMLSEHGRQPRLINITESGSREIIPLGKAMLLIGRTDEVNVALESTDISRNHASIIKLGEHYCLRDNGSTNGSYVNGERVKFKQLEHHDVIRFGSYTFLVDLGEEKAISEGEKKRSQVKIPPSHKGAQYTFTYNLEAQGGPVEAKGEGSPSGNSLTIMTKGFSAWDAVSKAKQKRTITICPSCKLEVLNPTFGVCSSCGEKLR